jgi:hypothetical protein
LIDEHGDQPFSSILDAAFVRALSREASGEESQALQALYDRQLAYFTDHPEDAASFSRVGNSSTETSEIAKLAAWSQVCRVILNLHETITRY